MESNPKPRIDASFISNILRGMSYPPPYKKALIVMCRPEDSKPEFVATVLGKFDKDVDIRDRWVSEDSSTLKKYWCGAVAHYKCALRAKLAARELGSITRSIKTIMFPQLLRVIIEAEVRYCWTFNEDTCVVIRGKKSLTDENARNLRNSLDVFGRMNRIRFYTLNQPNYYGTICEVGYEHATHALAAVVILNGLTYSTAGRISAELKLTKQTKKFIEYAKGIMVEFLNCEDSAPVDDCCDTCNFIKRGVTNQRGI